MCYAEADTPGLWFPEVRPGQLVSSGQMLGRVEDLEGRILQVIHARWEGMVLYQTVSLRAAAGDPLVACGRMEESAAAPSGSAAGAFRSSRETAGRGGEEPLLFGALLDLVRPHRRLPGGWWGAFPIVGPH